MAAWATSRASSRAKRGLPARCLACNAAPVEHTFAASSGIDSAAISRGSGYAKAHRCCNARQRIVPWREGRMKAA